MKGILSRHELLRHYFNKYNVVQKEAAKQIDSAPSQVSVALKGDNDKVLHLLVNWFLENFGDKEDVDYDDFFPPELNQEQAIKRLEENQKLILELLKKIESKK